MKTLFLFILFFSFPAAYAVTPDISIVNTVTQAMGVAASASIMPQALTWLGSFMLIQFLFTNINLIKSGADLETAWAKLLGSLLWFGFCVMALNTGPDFIDSVGSGIFTKFAPNLPTPGAIITSTLALCTSCEFAGT